MVEKNISYTAAERLVKAQAPGLVAKANDKFKYLDCRTRRRSVFQYEGGLPAPVLDRPGVGQD